MELKATGEFKVLPSRNADVRAEVTGIIEKISVDEWRAVRAGDLIARLFDRDYSADLRQTEGQIAEKTARLRMLKAGPRPRSEEHTSELQSHHDLVCRLLLEKKKKKKQN